MTRVHGDRYVVGRGRRTRELATGEVVPLDVIGDEEEACSEQDLAGLTELLEQGCEGTPRWVVAGARSAAHVSGITRRAAAAARRRGFVAISVGLYHRLGPLISEDLRDRALLLIGGIGDARPAWEALANAAAVSSRPHVLLTFRTVAAGGSVSETRGAYSAGLGPAADGPRRHPFSSLLDPRRFETVPGDIAQHILRAGRATVLARAGRHAAAERLLREVQGALQRRGAPGPAATVATTLGRLLLERGRARTAESTFESAAELAARETDDTAMWARAWQAWARIDLLRLTEAESLLRALLLAGTEFPARPWAQAGLVRCLLHQERADEAFRECERARLNEIDGATPVGVDEATLPRSDASGLDVTMAAAIGDLTVRASLATGRLFDAGVHAAACLEATAASAHALARAIAETAHLRVICAAGDFAAARSARDDVLHLAREAHAPFRAAEARLIWFEAARRSGRTDGVAAARTALERIARVAPPALKSAIETACQSSSPTVRPVVPEASGGHPAGFASTLVRMAQDEGDDRQAVQKVLEGIAGLLRTSRVDLISSDAGPVTKLLSVGAGLPTTLGSRILDSGLAIGFEAGPAAREAGAPVRLGSRLLAAVVCRWPLDRDMGQESRDLVDLAAAVMAPRIDALLWRSREDARASTAIPELVGVSGAMGEVRKAVARAAAAPFAVLIEGESGVGKELVARAIHQLGPRRERRLCDVNCAALPDELLESELFGHARGAFTGAVADRAGLIEEADGGTLFLDEVADLSVRAQAKLLRVVQQQEVRRVGEAFSRAVDVRFVAAANRDLREEVKAGRFRPDLLYRLDVIRFRIPPLRERPEDIAILAEHFWREAARRVGSTAALSPATLADLGRYHWPGNVRELQNVMAALAVAAPPRGRVRPTLLPAVIGSAVAVSSGRLDEARDQFERRFVEAALARAGGSRSKAAASLGISRQGLLKMLARLGIAQMAKG